MGFHPPPPTKLGYGGGYTISIEQVNSAQNIFYFQQQKCVLFSQLLSNLVFVHFGCSHVNHTSRLYVVAFVNTAIYAIA